MRVEHGPSCHTTYGKGYGNVDSDVVFVGIAPGKQEQKQGMPFVGPSGKFLDSSLKAVGLDRQDYYATNLVCWVENEPDDDDVARCWDRLKEELLGIKPKVIVAVGTKPMEHLIKGHKASMVRGYAMWSEEFDCWVIGTWHPSFILQMQSENLARDFLVDLTKIPHYLSPHANKRMGFAPYRLASSATDVNNWLSDRDSSDFLTLDVETTYDGKTLRSFAMAQGLECIVVKDPMSMKGQINWPLDKRWTFQNAMFDVAVINKFFDVELPISDDTMYMSYVLDERSGEENNEGVGDIGVGIHGLKKLAGAWCGSGVYDIKTEDATNEQLYPYNAKDAVYTYRLAAFFYPRMVQDGVEEAYKLTIAAANKAWRSKKRGMYVSKPYLAALGTQWIGRWMDLEDKLKTMAYELGWTEAEFNPNSHPQLKRLLYDVMGLPVNRGRGKNTQAKTLQESYPDNEFVEVLLEWRGVNKDIGTYVKTTMEAIDDKGYIHPDPVLHATVTSRWAYKNPPMQTIPQLRNVGEERAKLRRAFTVENTDERELAEGDYSQSEVWWAAYYGQDEQMFADLRSGDFHAGVTESVFKIDKRTAPPDVWKKKRADSKYVTFGVMFGRQARALHKEEMKEYTLEEVSEFIQNWYKRYKGYVAWRMGEQTKVKKEGEQQSLSGHKRRYPIIFNFHAFNQAFNMPVQCVSHANLMATYAEAFDTLVNNWDAWILLEIHDALVIDYPKKYRNEVLSYVKEVAERNRFGVSVPMEFKVGPNLRDMKEVSV